ncbi:MAG: hypothetical protein JWR67_1894, partial [Mucilaginibacter sp.]|nr:hypothetical protein [Mucilaginibacter sp.]
MNKVKLIAAIAVLLLCVINGYGKAKSKIVVYPAPTGEELNQGYKVSVAEKNVQVYNTKIAASDKAYRFKGIADIRHSDEYFEVAAFAYFDMQGSATVTVTVPQAITTVKILPTSAHIKATIQGHSVSFPVSSPNNLTIEINGEWVRSLHLFINPIETNKPDPKDPNVIFFGPGIHEITHLDVGDNKTVYIAGGAVVRAVIGADEKYTVNKSDSVRNYSPSVYLHGHHITICGRGILDASACPTHARNLIMAHGVTGLKLEGIILRDASTWNVPIRQCDSVLVDNIKILGYRANTDGIDICNSRNVIVQNCFLRTMDDLIVIKADKGQGDAQHILAKHCVLWNQLAHALSIGAELRDNVSDVTFTDCDIIHDKGREWSLRIYQCDAGLVNHVRFENIRIEEAQRFISLWIGKAVWSRDKDYGHIQDVTFKNITANGNPLTVDLVGIDDQHTVKEVSF